MHTLRVTSGRLEPGERVEMLASGPGYETRIEAVYMGVQAAVALGLKESGGSYHWFRDGIINGRPEPFLAFPLSRIVSSGSHSSSTPPPSN
jgi:hypothetical protein